MHRPVLPCSMALMIGVYLSSQVRIFLPAILLCFIIVVGISLLHRHIGYKHVCFLIVFYLIGFFLQSWNEAVVENSYRLISNQIITATVKIENAPKQNSVESTCSVTVRSIQIGEIAVSKPAFGFGNLQLRFDNLDNKHRCGDLLAVQGKITQLEPAKNPGGFNERQMLLADGVIAVLQVTSTVNIGHENTLLRDIGTSIHAHVKKTLLEALPEKEAYTLLGMLLGDTTNIEANVKAIFRISGLMHIMAVSGANVAFLVLPLLYLLRKLGMNKRWTGLVILPVLILFCLATGLEPSVVRAAWMAGFMLVGLVLYRKPDLACALGATAIVMVLQNTWILFDAGFQLSFMAVACLVIFEKKLTSKMPIKWPKFLRTGIGGSLAIQIGLGPLMASLFHMVSFWTIWANLLVLPLTGTLTMLGTIISFVGLLPFTGLLTWIGFVARILVDYLLWIAEAISSLPFAQLLVPSVPLLLMLGYIILVLWVRYAGDIPGAAKWHLRPLGIVAVLIITIPLVLIPSSKMQVLFLDVGQGDAVFIMFPTGESLLVDAGGNAFGERLDTIGEKVIVPAILAMGHFRPKQIVATHGHKDHVGGIPTVMEKLQCSKLLMSNAPDDGLINLAQRANAMSIDVGILKEGDQFQLGEFIFISVLSPGLSSIQENDANENALVLKIRYGEFELLLMGDAGQNTEARLLTTGLELDADVLKVGHHGSKYTSTNPFLAAVSPKEAIVSVGKNSFGHPSQESKDRLEESGAELHCTIDTGAVLITTDGLRYDVKHFGYVPRHWLSEVLSNDTSAKPDFQTKS